MRLLGRLQGVARQGAEVVAVRLGSLVGQQRPQAQLDGFKSRVLRAEMRVQERRWHYEIEWSCAADGVPSGSTPVELLLIGDVPPHLASHGHALVERDEGMTGADRWDAVAFTASLRSDAVVRVAELRVVDAALQLVQAQAMLDAAPAVWLYTTATQPVAHLRVHRNAGMWGLARACRQERVALHVWCCLLYTSPSPRDS